MQKLFFIFALTIIAGCGSSTALNKEIDADESGYRQSQKRIVISPHSGRVISK